MNDRDLSQYEVVREDFISDADGVQLNFNKGRMYINNYGLSKFPEEDYARILINKETRSLVIKPYKEKVRASYCWCGGKLKRKPRRVKCLPLFYQIYKMMQWDINARYRITGEIEDSGEEKIIFFDLDDAICFVRETASDNNAAGTTENGRTPQYHMQMPSEWEKHYGMPVMDYDTRQDVKTFGDMAVFDVTFELNKEIVRTENEKTETEKGAQEENNGKIENSGNVENDEKRGNCL